MEYPQDENGNTLKAIAESGVDLAVARDIEFAHLAPDEEKAEAFVAAIVQMGYETEIYEPH